MQYTLPVVDSDDGAAVPDLDVKACADAGCAQELPRCGSDGGECFDVSGDRELVFSFPFGFEGGLRFTAPGFLETNYVFGGPMVGTPDGELEVSGRSLAMVSVESLGAVDTQRGALMLRTLDCNDQPAGGVQVQPVAGNVVNEVSIGSLVTDELGLVTTDNMVPDAATVAAIAPSGVEYARATALVRANAMTVAELRPGLGIWGQ